MKSDKKKNKESPLKANQIRVMTRHTTLGLAHLSGSMPPMGFENPTLDLGDVFQVLDPLYQPRHNREVYGADMRSRITIIMSADGSIGWNWPSCVEDYSRALDDL